MERFLDNAVRRRSVHSVLRLAVLVAILLLSLCLELAPAAVIHVPADQATIQGAINAASDGDQIIVSPGTHYETINFLGKNIILRSTDPADESIVASTIIDARQNGCVVTFSGTEGTTCVLSGFSITGGEAANGGGINGNGALATIENNSITGNAASKYGAGVVFCNGAIRNNIISGNSAPLGAGIFFCGGAILNNTICQNSGLAGSGVCACNGVILNNMICDNAGSGVAAGLSYCNGIIENNTIAGNECAGLLECDGLIMNCIVWGNAGGELDGCSTPRYSCIENWHSGGTGNISADPQFVDSGVGDYHLQSGSPCVDAAIISYLPDEYIADIDGECRLAGAAPDIGCDEVASSPDGDHDLLADFDELVQGSDPDDPDSDGDGLEDGVEVLRGTSPVLYDMPSGISVPAGCSSVQRAIFFAFPSEKITVSPGTYAESLWLMGKNLVVQSKNPLDDAVVSTTIVDGGTLFPVVFFDGSEDESGAVKGLTLRNGSGRFGGGICGNGARAVIERNRIINNSATYSGGGIYRCAGTIQRNIISGNSSSSGAGLCDCDGIIQFNTISGNSGSSVNSDGGGLSLCDGVIRNNVISGNSAENGGGISSCDAAILNNTVWGNSAQNQGGGLSLCRGTIIGNTIVGNAAQSGGGLASCTGLTINCVIWANSAPQGAQLLDSGIPFYCCVQNWTSGGRGNIASNPQFVNAAEHDYHLKPGSPCIDAGNTYYLFGNYCADIDGECRVAGASVDIGSDEYSSSPDTDGDLLADDVETTRGCDLANPDTDGDGLSDGVEVLRGTNPLHFDAPSGISIPADYPSIQKAVFLAFPGEVVTISPGVYNENLRLSGRNIVLQSINPLDDAVTSTTIIDGNALASVVCCDGSENATSAIRGFTLRNGKACYGKGICGNGTHATIERNIITAGVYGGFTYGGGACDCDGVIQYNTISNNPGDLGGALCLCDGVIQHNLITGNWAGSGGGFHLCNGIIRNNTISGNSAYWGPGGGLSYCKATIEDNMILSNWSATGGGGMGMCEGTIADNTISGNSAWIGGGLTECTGAIQGNTISGNSAFWLGGGGMSICGGIIQNNVISGNAADGPYCNGGGLYGCGGTIQNNMIAWNTVAATSEYDGNGGGLDECYGAIRNNTIYGNYASRSGGGLAGCATAAITNLIIWQNAAPAAPQIDDASALPSYSCIEDWTGGGSGNISANPLLVDPGNGDFHLRKTSPCIDAGCYVPGLIADFEGDPRPYDAATEPRGDGSHFDIGADEFVPTCIKINSWLLY